MPVRAVDRLLKILEELGATPGLALGDLARQVDLAKPTALRLLRSLEERGWARRGADGTYSLGARALAAVLQGLHHDRLLAGAAGPMSSLRDSLDETVSLSALSGGRRVCLLQFPSSQALRYMHEVGSVAPLAVGASGKVLLAFGAAATREKTFAGELAAYTPSTITDAAALERECEHIREAGYAISFGERSIGSVAVAVPVRDPYTGSVYALTVFAPEVRFDVDRLPHWLEQLAACARAMEAAAGVSAVSEHV